MSSAIIEADVFAISMLAVILLAFAVIGMLLACMLRNSSRRDKDVDNLLDEIEAEEKAPKVPAAKSEAQPWERDGDWWKG